MTHQMIHYERSEDSSCSLSLIPVRAAEPQGRRRELLHNEVSCNAAYCSVNQTTLIHSLVILIGTPEHMHVHAAVWHST